MKVKVVTVAPEEAPLNEFFTLEYQITSLHKEVMDLKVVIENSEGLMMCGEAETRAKVQPGETVTARIEAIGLKPGFFPLPGLKLTDVRSKEKEETLKSVYNRYIRLFQGPGSIAN